MKLVLTMLTLMVLLVVAGPAAIAQEDVASEGATVMEEAQGEVVAAAEAVNVGNKICPVSGEVIGTMGEGVTVEYQGKIYNLCCPMCQKSFLEDPETYIQKVNEELEASQVQE